MKRLQLVSDGGRTVGSGRLSGKSQDKPPGFSTRLVMCLLESRCYEKRREGMKLLGDDERWLVKLAKGCKTPPAIRIAALEKIALMVDTLETRDALSIAALYTRSPEIREKARIKLGDIDERTG